MVESKIESYPDYKQNKLRKDGAGLVKSVANITLFFFSGYNRESP